MSRRRTATVAAVLMTAALLPAVSAAAPLTTANQYQPEGFFSFCNENQKAMANLSDAGLASQNVSVTSTIYSDFTDFVNSKSAVKVSGAKAIVTTTYVTYRDPGKTEAQQIRCKFRTAESLSQGAWPANSDNNGGRFAVEPYFGFGPVVGSAISTSPIDQQCSTLNQATINRVWDSLSPAEQDAAPYNPTGSATSTAAANTLVTVPDVFSTNGPAWTLDFPTAVINGSTLEVPSKAIVVPSGSAATPRFEGAHYCTLIAPDYLRDVLLGTAVVA